MDPIEYELVQAGGQLDAIVGSLQVHLGPVGSRDTHLRNELDQVIEQLTTQKVSLEGIASRWHYLES